MLHLIQIKPEKLNFFFDLGITVSVFLFPASSNK